MSTIEQTRMRGANDEHPSARWNELIGPQGETLIIELRTAKRAIDRVRHSGWRERVVSGRGQGVGPEQTLRFSRPSESLDRFDDRSLQNPIDSAGDRVLLKNDSPIESALPSTIQVSLRIVKAQIRWLFTGAATETDVTGDFAAQVVRRHEIELKTALRVLIASIVVVGIWATMVPISGAVVVPGTLVVESRVKKIQHPTGGVLAEIDVEDGTHVNAGTLLARLDQTQLQANQQIIADQLDQTRARIARLISERDGLSDIQTPQQLAGRTRDPSVVRLIASEVSLFKARSSARQSQQDLHENNIRQFEEQIGGLEAEIKSKSSQLDLIATELTGVQELYADEQRRRLKGVTLVSGMPVEVFLKTNSRTMLSYLFKPITDQFGRMFNEP